MARCNTYHRTNRCARYAALAWVVVLAGCTGSPWHSSYTLNESGEYPVNRRVPDYWKRFPDPVDFGYHPPTWHPWPACDVSAAPMPDGVGVKAAEEVTAPMPADLPTPTRAQAPVPKATSNSAGADAAPPVSAPPPAPQRGEGDRKLLDKVMAVPPAPQHEERRQESLSQPDAMAPAPTAEPTPHLWVAP